MKNFAEATLEDLQADPAAYGLPTFEEFCRNKDRWKKRRDHAFIQVDNGPNGSIKTCIKKTRYYVESDGTRYEADSIEAAEKILASEGLDMASNGMEWRSELIPLTSHTAEVHVTFRRKCLIARR